MLPVNIFAMSDLKGPTVVGESAHSFHKQKLSGFKKILNQKDIVYSTFIQVYNHGKMNNQNITLFILFDSYQSQELWRSNIPEQIGRASSGDMNILVGNLQEELNPKFLRGWVIIDRLARYKVKIKPFWKFW